MNHKKLIAALGYSPKDNTSELYHKIYNEYEIEVDLKNKKFNYGDKINVESSTTLNFSQEENWVVLECVDRLLEKGYKPKDITLEKTFKVGHGASGGRLDIFVTKNGKAFLMIECKTYGKEFNKEFANINKNGGQLFTYFQNDTATEYLMLYASKFEDGEVKNKQAIIKIEDHYREAGNVVDVFERWNKITLENGVFDSWVEPYNFENKRIIKKELIPLDEDASISLFHSFLSILRKHSVSDKPNAFNVIFDLFLAKLWDEKKEDFDEMDFQWKENEDDAVSFQYRLIRLYKEGMNDFLKKEVIGLSDDDFQGIKEEDIKKIKKKVLMLERVFNIKTVLDEESFEENQRVLKEIVELLQKYQIRYPRKQQHLSDFFERLLTTGLKQEAGQFFTPPPITKFIVRSIPIKDALVEHVNQPSPELPAMIDNAVGSGHFLTELMEEYQSIINGLDISNFRTDAKKKIESWRIDEYSWASKYIYGVDIDYRLVKVAKVGCYFYGDGLAQVIHGDGLDNFATSKKYRGLLKENAKSPQFQFVLSNPPYSVSTFKTNMKSSEAEKDFSLFNYMTDRSSEIECLFVERTKQLLKTDGVTALILPSSILSNSGVQTKTRDILLKSFDILAITELGSNTFMATGTNTVVLFMRRKDDKIAQQIEETIEKSFVEQKDYSTNGIEKPINKYISDIWEDITYDDYKSLMNRKPNEKIVNHEIYKDYDKSIKEKDSGKKWNKIISTEKEKALHYTLAYNKKVVLVKTGSKKKEKQFLGYEFSNRRGSEGMHPVQRSKTVDGCTKLYDPKSYDNPEKASTYIYEAFAKGNFDLDIDDSLKNNVSYQNLTDMITFDRVDFDKSISLSAKKKVIITSKYNQTRIENLFLEIKNGKNVTQNDEKGKFRVSRIESISNGKFDIEATKWTNDTINENDFLKKGDFLFSHINSVWHLGKTGYFNLNENVVHGVNLLRFRPNQSLVLPKYVYEIFNQKVFVKEIQKYAKKAANQASINVRQIDKIKIPLPPLDVQKKIVDEIEVLEKQEEKAKSEVEELKGEIFSFIDTSNINKKPLKYYLDSINPSKSETIKDLDPNTNVSFLGMADVSNDGEIIEMQPRLLKKVKTGYTFFQNEDVLFAKITPCTENGKGAFVNGLINNLGFGSTEFFVLRANKMLISPKLLFYITQYKDFRINAERHMTGTSGHRRVPKSFVENYEVSPPPIEEQEKVVAEIEKIEEKIYRLEQQIANIPTQKEAVLKKYL